jgi:hypothetical protein
MINIEQAGGIFLFIMMSSVSPGGTLIFFLEASYPS